MIILRNLKLPLDTDFSDPKTALTGVVGALPKGTKVTLYKRAIDARRGDVTFSCAFTLESAAEQLLLKKLKKFNAEPFSFVPYVFLKAEKPAKRPVVVGFGPAGMFAAYVLARAGLRPVVLEQGRDADRRKADVEAFFHGGALNVHSNVQFGEGGAGTFSDGKLNTGIKDPRIRTVLEIFARHGAGERILYDAKPHIGTDVLINVVKSIRKEIMAFGGEVLFEHQVTDIHIVGGRVAGVSAETPDGGVERECDSLILAPGHSARETFFMLKHLAVEMEPKPFAIGARIEHLQSDIDKIQYGAFAGHQALGAADYRLAAHLQNGRGVFTFCMCPGGEVVNASSEAGGVAVNGMSFSKRNGRNANSAVLTGVEVSDYFHGDALDGIYFQREIERKAFSAGCGLPVCQTLGDFLGKKAEGEPVIPSVKTGVTYGDIRDVLPRFAADALAEGILLFDQKMHGFANLNAVLTAPETRSSSPVRILRNTAYVSSITGLYPCGEGAGYAGGITSAAVDGIKTAEMVIHSVNNGQ